MLATLALAAALNTAITQPVIQLETNAAGQWIVHSTGSDTAPLTIRVDAGADLPPLLGKLTQRGNEQIFEPRFPLQAGVRYRASLGIAETVLEIPGAVTKQTTTITQVYPSTDTLPENQLKFYIQFSQPMARGGAYDWLHLLDDKGQEVSAAFLQLNEELWDPEFKRFTLYFDPGRVKSDLLPGRELGAPLHAGRQYTLVIDGGWPDALGRKLGEGYRKSFRVADADHHAPDPQQWRIDAPPANSSNALQVTFPESMDQALASRLIVVLDSRGSVVNGAVTLNHNETQWQFVPARNWQAGNYSLRVATALEDLAGNKIGRLFEMTGSADLLKEQRAEFVSIPLRIQLSLRSLAM
ncbi:MAG: hypothetical protein QM808_00680 [Steroidobacteraceae bacterium]